MKGKIIMKKNTMIQFDMYKNIIVVTDSQNYVSSLTCDFSAPSEHLHREWILGQNINRIKRRFQLLD